MSDLVTVIIPNYNHEKYLKKRIHSVLNQTHTAIEVIILDDCSTDNSREIMERFRDHPKVMAILYNESNSGSTFKQWIKGLQKAKGNWIWIAESDDYCDEFFLEDLLKAEVPMVCGIRFCASWSVDESDAVVGGKQPTINGGVYTGVEFLQKFQIASNHITNASAVIFRKELLLAALDEKSIGRYKILGDYLTYVRILLNTHIYFSTLAQNYHRKHLKSVRSVTEKDGTHYREAKFFRDDMKKMFSTLKDVKQRKQLTKANNDAVWADEGFRAMHFVQTQQYWKSITPLLRATFRPRFTFYYLKGYLYWLINRRN